MKPGQSGVDVNVQCSYFTLHLAMINETRFINLVSIERHQLLQSSLVRQGSLYIPNTTFFPIVMVRHEPSGISIHRMCYTCENAFDTNSSWALLYRELCLQCILHYLIRHSLSLIHI